MSGPVQGAFSSMKTGAKAGFCAPENVRFPALGKPVTQKGRGI